MVISSLNLSGGRDNTPAEADGFTCLDTVCHQLTGGYGYGVAALLSPYPCICYDIGNRILDVDVVTILNNSDHSALLTINH